MLILFSPPLFEKNEFETLTEMYGQGLKYFHLRKPSFSEQEMEKYLSEMPRELIPHTVLHDHFELAVKYQCKGIHFTGQYLKNNPLKYISTAKNFSESGFSVSRSIHSPKELTGSLSSIYDYIFAGPLFNSISKFGYKATYNCQQYASLLKTYPVKLIGLGGIDESNFRNPIQSGFEGIAILGCIWFQENEIEKRVALFSRIKNLLQEN